ncbi:MAG: hypothetical protein HOL01_08245 [Planctomycetaceae bacterium]|nr:hypothetical protein [Planctomycetaceae bacterium]
MPKNQMIDNRLESYRSFFDRDWAKEINALVDGTQLDPLVFNLGIAWKGAANTHMMPWLLVDSIGGFADSFVNAHEPPTARLISALVTKLDDEVHGKIRPMMRKELKAAIQRISNQVDDAFESQPYRFDRDEYWMFYLEQSEFQVSLIASQRLCYAGLFFGYEDFVVNCYKILTSVKRYQTGRSTNGDFEKAFGPEAAQFCWSDDKIQIARLVRNDLVHNGARISPKLQELKHGLTVIDGELQILACDTSMLFHQLKKRALQLADSTLSLITE